MADNDIKQRIVLDGEKEYSAALKEAQRNLKVLRSELKAETAELGKNATEQQKNETRTKNLQKQIKEQEKVVRTYEKALAEIREKYSDNEEAIAKWEVKLNNARTALANMKGSLSDVSAGMQGVKTSTEMSVVATNSLASSLEKVGSVGASVSGAIESAFTGILGTITDTISTIWTQVTEIAAMADNYEDLAAFFGSSATDVQKWSKAMEGAGGNLSAITSLITRIRYGGKDDKVTEWFGVSGENYENDLEYAQAVLQQMYNMKDEMKANGTWAQAMSDIMGAKKTQELDGVLSDWEQILAGLDRFDVEKGGIGLDEKQIQDMATLSNNVNTLLASWKALKEMATVELFGDLALNITGNLQNIVDAFKEYFDAEDEAGRKEALETVKENIKEIFLKIKEAIQEGLKLLDELAEELKNDEDATVRALGNVLEKIVDAFEWFMDENNWEKVKKGFEAIIGIWAVGKVGSAVANIAKFGANVATIGQYFGLGGKGDGGQSLVDTVTQAGGGGGGGTVTGAATGGGLWAGLKAGATKLLSAVAAPLAGSALIAGWVATISAIVNDANAKAQKEREVQADADRFSGMTNGQQRAIVTAVTSLESMTAGEGTGKALQNLAGGLGAGLLDAFNYTNTSGQSRNKLIDMLDMDDQNAAVAAMMLHAAGVDLAQVDYSAQYKKYQQMLENGSLGYSWGLTTMQDFFNKSGYRDANGNWLINGYTPAAIGSSGGAPNPWELSGYANTTNKPTDLANFTEGYWVGDEWRKSVIKMVSIDPNGGTWDPTVDHNWWSNPGDTSGTGSAVKNALEALPKRLADNMTNIKVIMDGVTVGHLVAQTVSEDIAKDVVP